MADQLITELAGLNINSEQSSENSASVQPPISKKEAKKNLTSYWGVHLDTSVFETCEQIKTFFENNKEVIPLKKIHSTLLYVGKKDDNPNEVVFDGLHGKECKVVISGYGYSENALAFNVDKITHMLETEEKSTPTFAVQQHVTLGLKEGTKAVDSVKTLLGEGTYVELPEKLVLTGTIKRFLF